jgi:hypothetical protein
MARASRSRTHHLKRTLRLINYALNGGCFTNRQIAEAGRCGCGIHRLTNRRSNAEHQADLTESNTGLPSRTFVRQVPGPDRAEASAEVPPYVAAGAAFRVLPITPSQPKRI